MRFKVNFGILGLKPVPLKIAELIVNRDRPAQVKQQMHSHVLGIDGLLGSPNGTFLLVQALL